MIVLQLSSFLVARSSDGWRITVPDDLAFFDGHFPRRPIVPGAALLQLTLQQVAEIRNATAVVLDRVRFQRLVEPGARFDLRLETTADSATFCLADPQGVLAQGALRCGGGEPAHGRDSCSVGGDIDVAPPVPLSALLPHGPEAMLLRDVPCRAGERLQVGARLPADSPYARGTWASAALVEAAAQAAAAHMGLAAAPQAGIALGPRPGYLVGVKRARLVADLPRDPDFTVCVQRTGGSGPLAIYAASVTAADAELFHAELSVWTLPPEPPT